MLPWGIIPGRGGSGLNGIWYNHLEVNAMTDNNDLIARLEKLVNLLNADLESIRVHCESGCGDHDAWGIRLYQNGSVPHIVVYPGDDIIDDHLDAYEEEEEEERIVWTEAPSEQELEDQARNDWQKSQPSTGDPEGIVWKDLEGKKLDDNWGLGE